MLALLVVALVGSALARPQQLLPPVFQAPAPFPVQPIISPIPVRSAFAPLAPVAQFRTVINDAPVFAAPVAIRPAITTVQRIYQADDSGQFTSSHTDSAGSNVAETGSLVPTNDGLDRVLVKSGSFSYISPEGTPISVTYTADARGFHPISNAIPISPQPIQPTF